MTAVAYSLPAKPRRTAINVPYHGPRAMSRDDCETMVRAICAHVAAGGLVMDALEDHQLHPQQWWDILETNGLWREAFARARISQAHAFAEESFHLLASVRGDKSEVIQWARLACEQRRWFVSKIAPRIYGERLDITSAGHRVGVIAMPEEDSESPALPSSAEVSGVQDGGAEPVEPPAAAQDGTRARRQRAARPAGAQGGGGSPAASPPAGDGTIVSP